MEKQAHKNIVVCSHLPYSWDLALCNFWLFFNIKMTIKDKYFESEYYLKRQIERFVVAIEVQLKPFMKEVF